MITLLRNFTDITCPRSGHDSLPNCTEITPAADLARIKYYRNYLAHLDYSRVESKHFNDAWKTISEVCYVNKKLFLLNSIRPVFLVRFFFIIF